MTSNNLPNKIYYETVVENIHIISLFFKISLKKKKKGRKGKKKKKREKKRKKKNRGHPTVRVR